jgi:hypothetical protein
MTAPVLSSPSQPHYTLTRRGHPHMADVTLLDAFPDVKQQVAGWDSQ